MIVITGAALTKPALGSTATVAVVTAKVQVAPVVVSVIVRAPAAEPHVSTPVAVVDDVCVIVPSDAPVPPLKVNRVWTPAEIVVLATVITMADVVPLKPAEGATATVGVV